MRGVRTYIGNTVETSKEAVISHAWVHMDYLEDATPGVQWRKTPTANL